MGGSPSKTVLPPRIIQQPYPASTGLNNLSLAPGTTSACRICDIEIDSRATTSSVKLTRDFGNISTVECMKYQEDLDAVRKNEMSFRDFFVNLQAGNYSRPIARTERGEFCEQVMFSEEDAAKVTSLKEFDENVSKLKSIRIRQVTGGGSFSSGTKAKFRLSIPIKIKVVVGVQTNPPVTNVVKYTPKVHTTWFLNWDAAPVVPVTQTIDIHMLTMYHPSPLRIENVQHDAILSLNDPSDPKADVVFLIPLKSSNMNDESVDFFTKITKHVTTLQTPDSITGLYPETDIPTGNDWNIKQILWLDKTGADNMSKVTDAFYTWVGASMYSRYEKSRRTIFDNGLMMQEEITYGWKPEGKEVRYYMLQTPVSISASDLSFLTRSLPPTPAENAIHKVPDPSIAGNPKILYKQATGPAAQVECGTTRERMTNPGSLADLLVDEKGSPLSDEDSCDPFAMNTRNALKRPSVFTPTKLATWIFNILLVVAVALGTWLALYLVTTQNYDYKFRDFSNDAGKVIGKLAKRASENVKTVSSAVSSLRSVSSGLGQKGSLTNIPGAAAPEPQSQ